MAYESDRESGGAPSNLGSCRSVQAGMRTPPRTAISVWASMVLAAILTTASVLALRLPDVDRIDQLIRRSHARGIFNGNVLVARTGHIVYEQALGYADAALHTPLTLEYRFNIGSIGSPS